MTRKFITQREVDFIGNVTKELIQGVVEEEVRYYAISLERSKTNMLYEEAIDKHWDAPVAVNALVRYDQGPTVAGRFSLDSTYTLEVYFHRQELNERNVEPKEGDFLEYGGVFYEITSATMPQIVYGQIQNKVMVKCTCIMAREGQFSAGSNSDQYDDRDAPQANNSTGNTPVKNPISTDRTYATNPLPVSGSL